MVENVLGGKFYFHVKSRKAHAMLTGKTTLSNHSLLSQTRIAVGAGDATE